MSTISEKIELLGKGLYKDIPDTITIKAIPTSLELDYIGSEDFDNTMIDKILPQAIEEKINIRNLLEIDYQWVCRCLRLINYGPYHTVNAVFCPDCKQTSRGEYSVDLRSIECVPLPEDFKNSVKISGNEFILYKGDVEFKLPTIQEALNAYQDKAFVGFDGKINRELARMCYMVTSMNGEKGLTPIEYKIKIEKDFCPADYKILKEVMNSLSDYGMRAGGTTTCPKCNSNNAAFIALTDDRFFRTTLDDLRRWKSDRNSGEN